MDKLTVNKIIELINQHIYEINNLPGNTIGRAATIDELKLLINELRELTLNKN